MPRVTGTVPNLINGISQQSPALRLPSQGEICDNFYPTIVDGLVPRPPTEHLASLGAALPPGTFTQIMLRDDSEKYILAIQPDGQIKVWDFAGNAKTVNNLGAAYLAGMTSPAADLRALTVADHTFIVNKRRVVAAGTTRSPTRPKEALISVLSGNYAKTYQVYVNSGLSAQNVTPDGGDASHGPYVETTYIAGQLYANLAANGAGAAPWSLGLYHSTIYIANTSADFTLATTDGYAGRAMKEVKGFVAKFSDLPSHGIDGFVVKVAGDVGQAADDYWVQFKKTSAADSAGLWRECIAPNTLLGLDASTMPHLLVREANGSFTFRPAAWDNRGCGTELTCPDPSFVGAQIQDVFFHRNRLGFLTEENYVFSQAGDFFNFYRTTMTALLDSDPIDGAASHIKVSLLRHAVPYSEVLILFSDQTQFKLDGNELFTPKTVNARPLSELGVKKDLRPLAVGSNIYFVAEGEQWAALYEYFIDKQIQSAEAENVSGHAPAYVPAGVKRMVASNELDLVVLQTTGDPRRLYIYKYHWNGQEKLQSAWARWAFPGGDILDIAFDRKKLVLLIRREGGLFLERLDAETGVTDGSAPYTTFLDRRCVVSAIQYDPVTNTTTYACPFPPPYDGVVGPEPNSPVAQTEGSVSLTTVLKAVTLGNDAGFLPRGVELPILSAGPNSIVVAGYPGDAIRVGVEYKSRYRFSPLFYRGQDGKAAQQDGHLQLYQLNLTYAKSAQFALEVTAEGRPSRVYPFAGRFISDINNRTGSLPLDDGRFNVPIFSRNDRVTIDIVRSTWRPATFSSAQWRGVWNPNNRQQ